MNALEGLQDADMASSGKLYKKRLPVAHEKEHLGRNGWFMYERNLHPTSLQT